MSEPVTITDDDGDTIRVHLSAYKARPAWVTVTGRYIARAVLLTPGQTRELIAALAATLPDEVDIMEASMSRMFDKLAAHGYKPEPFTPQPGDRVFVTPPAMIYDQPLPGGRHRVFDDEDSEWLLPAGTTFAPAPAPEPPPLPTEPWSQRMGDDGILWTYCGDGRWLNLLGQSREPEWLALHYPEGLRDPRKGADQ